MSKHSPARAGVALLPGLQLFSRGKVRDTYELTDGNLLSVATDGISIFDFVLNALVPQKGIILNAMNHFWLKYLYGFGVKTHLVAAGSEIDRHLPENLKNNVDLQSRAIVIKHLQMVPVEFIARAVLTGSAVRSYKENGQICGHQLIPGLQDGDALPYILDTPTTKAEQGHDEDISARQVREKYPQQTILLLQIFQIASHYAEKKGIKLADTKLEFGQDGTVGDEILTPDSSRFWLLKDWQRSREPATDRKSPASYDKQLVRDWGRREGIHKLDPKDPEHMARVHSLVVPEQLIAQTMLAYHNIFRWVTDTDSLNAYLRDDLGIAI